MIKANGQVLIVDDTPEIREAFKFCLELEGFQVLTAGDGAEALETLKSKTPGVILLDMNMPRVDGLEFLSRRSRIPEIPVIAASANPEFKEEALRRGATLFLNKPLGADVLISAV